MAFAIVIAIIIIVIPRHINIIIHCRRHCHWFTYHYYHVVITPYCQVYAIIISLNTSFSTTILILVDATLVVHSHTGFHYHCLPHCHLSSLRQLCIGRIHTLLFAGHHHIVINTTSILANNGQLIYATTITTPRHCLVTSSITLRHLSFCYDVIVRERLAWLVGREDGEMYVTEWRRVTGTLPHILLLLLSLRH